MKSHAAVQIKGLKLKVIIGTQPHEREALQDVVADVSFEYDASLAAQTDALGHAVDYAAVHARILERVSGTKFFLLERLAGAILELIMEDSRIVSAAVTLQKQGVLPGVDAVSVRLSAGRSGGGQVSTTRCYQADGG